jgi:hypothetical protein
VLRYGFQSVLLLESETRGKRPQPLARDGKCSPPIRSWRISIHIGDQIERTPSDTALPVAGDPAERFDSALSNKLVRILRRREMFGSYDGHSRTRGGSH